MKKGWIWSLVLGAALSTGAVAKDHDNDKGKGHDHGNSASARHEDDRWETRGRWEYRVYDRDERPPGWSKGKKTGWGDCNLPPGQAKKYGCNTYKYQGRDYYWYRDEHERIIVRRPVIHVHASVDAGF